MALKRIAKAWNEFKSLPTVPPPSDPEVAGAFYHAMECAFYAGVVILGEMIIKKPSSVTMDQLMEETSDELREYFKKLKPYQKPHPALRPGIHIPKGKSRA